MLRGGTWRRQHGTLVCGVALVVLAATARGQSSGPFATNDGVDVTALTCYYGLVGYNLLPFSRTAQQDFEVVLSSTIPSATSISVRSIKPYQGWDNLPSILQVVAIKIMPAQQAPRPQSSPQQGGSNGGGSGTAESGTARRLAARRMLRGRRHLLAGENDTSGAWGPPQDGVIVRTDVTLNQSMPAGVAKQQVLDSLDAIRHELNTTGSGIALDLLDMLRPGDPPPDFEDMILDSRSNTTVVEALDASQADTILGNIAIDSGSGWSIATDVGGWNGGDWAGGPGGGRPTRNASSADWLPEPVVVEESSFPPGLAAGIAVACIVAVALLGLAVWKRRQLLVALGWRKHVHDEEAAAAAASAAAALPALPGSGDSLLPSDAVTIVRRPDGSDWVLGEGAMGSVYRGLLHGKLPVAIKVLRGSSAAAHEVNQEVALLKACRNTNIVQFQGVALHSDGIWLVQELCETDLFTAIGNGKVTWHTRNTNIVQFQGVALHSDGIWLVQELCETDLFTAIGNGKVTWHTRGRKIALDVARGLHFLHSNKVVHLDLKSPNVLLTAAGTAKICDVGLSRILTSTHVTQAEYGTFAWCAPEVLLAQRATEAADIFSFGVVLWEMVTGLRPVRGQLREVQVPEECPEQVKDLMQRCLSSDLGARPTAAQIIEELSPGVGRGLSSVDTARVEMALLAAPALPASGVSSTAPLLKQPPGGGSGADASPDAVARGAGAGLGVGASLSSGGASAATSGIGSSLEPSHSHSPESQGSGRAVQRRAVPDAEGQGQPPPQHAGEQAAGGQGGGGETFDQQYARLLSAAWQQAERASMQRRPPLDADGSAEPGGSTS